MLGCGPKVPPGRLADSADTAPPADSDSAVTGPDDDCDGRDDDHDGVVDNGAAPGWWADPARWHTVASFEDAVDQRFVGGLAAGAETTWVVVQEVTGDFTDAALSLRRVDEAGTTEIARLAADAGGLPFAYAAAVDAAGVLWIGGIRYDAAAGTRHLLVARWDGVLTELATGGAGERVRVVAGVGADAGAWFGGYADPGDGTATWTVWRVDAGGAHIVDQEGRGGEGRVEGLISDGTGGWAAGWELDATGAATGVLRTLDEAGAAATIRAAAGVRYTGLADGPGGSPWLGVTDDAGAGWTVEDVDGRAVDVDPSATLGLLAASPGHVWAAGTRAGDLGSDVWVRAGDAGGFGTSLDGVAADGWVSEPHDLVVGPRGDVWVSVAEVSADGSAPVRGRVLHLDCR